MRLLLSISLAAGLAISAQAQALNILLTNDDGYDHPNLRALYQQLRHDGHTVRVAAPWKEQSARGGGFFYGRETSSGRDTDPDYPDSYYLKTTDEAECLSTVCAGQPVQVAISATPVMSVLYGLQHVMPHPDLVISGPNVGHNIGALNAISGTYNAALAALQTGVPALAVSADLKEQDPQRIAQIVGRLVALLEKNRLKNGPLLPKGTGLNLNIPRSDGIKGFKLTNVGTYAPFQPVYTEDLGPLFPKLAGKTGISFEYTAKPGPQDEDSEAVRVAEGYITLSAFGGAPQDKNLRELPGLNALSKP